MDPLGGRVGPGPVDKSEGLGAGPARLGGLVRLACPTGQAARRVCHKPKCAGLGPGPNPAIDLGKLLKPGGETLLTIELGELDISGPEFQQADWDQMDAYRNEQTSKVAELLRGALGELGAKTEAIKEEYQPKMEQLRKKHKKLLKV